MIDPPQSGLQQDCLQVYLLGQARVVCERGDACQTLSIQRKPLLLLAYLALNGDRGHRREVLQACFWPDKSPAAAANNLRQALWHLNQSLPDHMLDVQPDTVQWHAEASPWVDATAFEMAVAQGDLDRALALYQGPLLPAAYDEWAQLTRERLHLRYLETLEARAQRAYRARQWVDARQDVDCLLAADPLNEAAARLSMACHWALGQREAARRVYDGYRGRVRKALDVDPLPETTALYRSILRGEQHPDCVHLPDDADIAEQTAHLSLLETLGAFRQGLARATAWGQDRDGEVLAAARRWQGRFYLRLGQLNEAHAALVDAEQQARSADLRASVLADLATVETGRGHYPQAAAYYGQAIDSMPLSSPMRLRLLSSLGGLQGRLGHTADARGNLQEAVRLARAGDDPAPLAIACGNLGILLTSLGETTAAVSLIEEALDAARRADAHWLTAHLTGHLGVLAQDRADFGAAAEHYRQAQALSDLIGNARSAALWTMNLGIVHYEQGRYAEALPLLRAGRDAAAAQGSQSLEAGADIFIGSCLVARDRDDAGLDHIARGLSRAQTVGDQQRILMGYLHKGRALALLGRPQEAETTLQTGLEQARASQMQRMEAYLDAELSKLVSLH